MQFSKCPRCGDQAFEYLESYGHCVGCLYWTESAAEYVQIPTEILKQNEIMRVRPEPRTQRHCDRGVA